MSIFRESFPPFIQDEIKRRQDGMLARTPSFLHELNTRSAWVRLTSGVNYDGNSDLAKKYVLQGGVLNLVDTQKDSKGNITDTFGLKSGLGSGGTSYDNLSQGGASNRLGIRAMPGITNISIQSKGAYGSLQEAVVSFVCWDIRQLEELEILYMRPGYTVLLEFGWNYAKTAKGTFPSYDILNKSDLTLNDAFKDIYQLITESNGNYDALLGYVKNYSWSARDDGGYDCTTSIISLGEVLESLKCNWVPMETNAFNSSKQGLLSYEKPTDNIIEAYERGIIPGLLQELWNISGNESTGENVKGDGSIVTVVEGNDTYSIYIRKIGNAEQKNGRGGLTKHMGAVDHNKEVYISLGDFCDLLNKYVLLKGVNNAPLVQVTTREQTSNGVLTKESLKCIASPLSLSTNLGVCFVKNDNWDQLDIQVPDEILPTPDVKPDVAIALKARSFQRTKSGYEAYYRGNIYNRFVSKISKEVIPNNLGQSLSLIAINPGLALQTFTTGTTEYIYTGYLEEDFKKLSDDLLESIVDIQVSTGMNEELEYTYITTTGDKFTISTKTPEKIDFTLFFGLVEVGKGSAEKIYNDLFYYNYDGDSRETPDGKIISKFAGYDSSLLGRALGLRNEDPFTDGNFKTGDLTKRWVKADVITLINKYLTSVSLNNTLQQILLRNQQNVAKLIAQQVNTETTKYAKNFLVSGNTDKKQLGNIANIYVNLNFLYDQAISRNVAANDVQNKNNISISQYLQNILKEIQNSLGNVNNFDLQVDNRNAIGRIIDINFTGDPSVPLSTLQIHNINSVVRSYKFASKIFPEMGSIIAISAQDPEGVGRLGYDNATLVAWNEGISDRLIPKKDFNSDMRIAKAGDPANKSPVTFLLPFLTKVYDYFRAINGKGNKDDINYAYGGLNFSYRDFLANLDRFDERNLFKTIIPTELSITLDGLGGVIIGNLFKINQDIVPKGYSNVATRQLAYIVTKLGHNIADNDWTTELSAYPVVFENKPGKDVQKQWDGQEYPGSSLTVRAGSNKILSLDKTKSTCGFNQTRYSTAVKFFISKGYSKEATAALVGSFLQESELNPQIVNFNDKLAIDAPEQTYAAGIAQWIGRGGRRSRLLKYAKNKGINIPNYDEAYATYSSWPDAGVPPRGKQKDTNTIIKRAFSNIDLQTQLDYVNIEAATYKGFANFKTTTNLNDAILWVYEIYEGGNYTAGASIGNREGYALDIINRSFLNKPCGSAAPAVTTATTPAQPAASPPAASKPAPSPSPAVSPSPTPKPSPSAVANWKVGEHIVTGVESKNGVTIQYDVVKDTTPEYYTIILKKNNAIIDEINVGPILKDDVIAQAKEEAQSNLPG